MLPLDPGSLRKAAHHAHQAVAGLGLVTHFLDAVKARVPEDQEVYDQATELFHQAEALLNRLNSMRAQRETTERICRPITDRIVRPKAS